MLGGSLSRFHPDDYQAGNGILGDILRGGLEGVKRSRNPLKAPGNTFKGLKSRIDSRGQTQSGASDQERTQQTRQESLVQQERPDYCPSGQCPISQTDQESPRHFWSLKKKKMRPKRKMAPVHSRPRAIHSDRGLPQYGGWLAASVKRLPEYQWIQELSRRRRPQRGGGYKNRSTRRPAPSRRKRRRR